MPIEFLQVLNSELARQVPWVGATATLMGLIMWWMGRLQRQWTDFYREQQAANERRDDKHNAATDRVIERHDAAERRMAAAIEKLSDAIDRSTGYRVEGDSGKVPGSLMAPQNHQSRTH